MRAVISINKGLMQVPFVSFFMLVFKVMQLGYKLTFL